MREDFAALDRTWPQLAGPVRDDSLALAVGVFSAAGGVLYLNRGMRLLLGGDDPPRSRTDYFINPAFSRFWETGDDAQVFDGLLTLGDGLRINRTLKARAWRTDDQLLVAGELDVLELDRLNTALSRTNQEINNLQRELIKKNHLLEETLSQLRRTQAMLIHAEKMNALGQLVAGVAHEVNNPLGFVIGNLHSLQENVDDLNSGYQQLEVLAEQQGVADSAQKVRNANQIDYIQEDLKDLFTGTQDGLGRIQGIVENLRTFSRLHEAECKEVDLRENLLSTLALADPRIKEKQIQVETAIDDLPPVECYAAELNQVFMNLIINAVQAMEPAGCLRIEGRARDTDWVELSFTDSGSGIPEAVIGKIFDPFFTTKPVGSGTGLGLSIAHEIITDHHAGRIDVESSPGTGSCFTLHLPCRLPSPVT